MLVVRDYEADWAVGARGGEDYWARAERIIKIRIAGELTNPMLYSTLTVDLSS